MKDGFILLILIFLTGLSQANSQTITEQIRSDGKIIDVRKSLSRWQPLWDAADNSKVKMTHDLNYDSHVKLG